MPSRMAAAADYVQSGLTANDLAPRPDPSGIRTPEEIRAATLAQAQAGKWAPSGADDGLTLLYDDKNGHYTPVLRSDGSRVEIKFGALPTPDPAVVRRVQLGDRTFRNTGAARQHMDTMINALGAGTP